MLSSSHRLTIRPTVKCYKRRIWNYKLADYDKNRELFAHSRLETLVNNDTSNDIVDNIMTCIIKAAEEAIPNKIVTMRPTEYPWMAQTR